MVRPEQAMMEVNRDIEDVSVGIENVRRKLQNIVVITLKTF
jgi:hypothetical protein